MKRRAARRQTRNRKQQDAATEKAFGEIAARFGEVAKALGFVIADDVQKALHDQQASSASDPAPRKIGDILVANGKITEENVRQILREQRELEGARLKSRGQVRGFLAARKKERETAAKAESDEGPDGATGETVPEGSPDGAGPPDLAKMIQELARAVEELEQKSVSREKAEEIAAGAALDVLKLYEDKARRAIESVAELTQSFEKREFARKVAESLATGICRKALQEPVGDIVHFEFEQALDSRARKVFSSQLDTPGFVEKLKDIAGASREIDRASQRLAARLDKIERETLPQRVESLFNQKLQDKLGDLSPETIAEKLDGKVLEKQLMKLSGTAVRDVMASAEFRAVVEESLFHAAMSNIANTPEFKSLLDEKFKSMVDYLSREVIPKQVERLGSG